MDLPGKKQKPNLPKQERSRSRWTSSQDKIFADLVVEQVQQGNRSNNMFDQKAWMHIRDQFNAQTGLNFNKKQLRKHLEVLRIRYDNLKAASEQSVFNMEEPTRMILPDYELWGNLIEEAPRRETLKIKDCPIFYQLCLIFNETGSDGKYAQSSHYEGLEKNAIGVDSPCARSLPKSEIEHANEGCSNKNTSNKRKKSLSETPDTPQHDMKNQERLTEAMAQALSDMVSASKIRAMSTSQHDDRFSIRNCIRVLDEICDIDESLYFAAVDMFDYPSEREIFMSLQSDVRVRWLHEKGGNVSSSSVI